MDLDEVTDEDALALKLVRKVEETVSADEKKNCCPAVSEPIVSSTLKSLLNFLTRFHIVLCITVFTWILTL